MVYTKGEVGLISFLVGVLGGLSLIFPIPPVIHNVKVFPRENKPAVMRLYKPGTDGIFVEDSKNPGSYVGLSYHLSQIPDKADRNVEKAEIERAVEWYK